MKEVVRTDKAHGGVGPYSQAVKANGFVGSSGLKPQTGKMVEGGFEAQTRQALKNVAAVLAAAGSGWESAVKTAIFVTDMNNFNRLNEIYANDIGNIPPARTTVEVSRLPAAAMIEIDVIALA